MKKLVNKKIFLFCICTHNREKQLIKSIRSIYSLKKKNNYFLKILIIENNLNSKIKKIKKNFQK